MRREIGESYDARRLIPPRQHAAHMAAHLFDRDYEIDDPLGAIDSVNESLRNVIFSTQRLRWQFGKHPDLPPINPNWYLKGAGFYYSTMKQEAKLRNTQLPIYDKDSYLLAIQRMVKLDGADREKLQLILGLAASGAVPDEFVLGLVDHVKEEEGLAERVLVSYYGELKARYDSHEQKEPGFFKVVKGRVFPIIPDHEQVRSSFIIGALDMRDIISADYEFREALSSFPEL